MANDYSDTSRIADQYSDSSNLDSRIILHEKYSIANGSFREWQFDQFDLPSDAKILVLGCGSADVWSKNCERIPSSWEITLTDLTPGMLNEARYNLSDCSHSFEYHVLDAARIPFEDEQFDAVTAHHMLYHVPNRDVAISEIHRVLRPAGHLYATTNGESNMQSIKEVVGEVLGDSLLDDSGFTLENGRKQLAETFNEVTITRREDALVVPKVEPLVAYALSYSDVSKSKVEELREKFATRFEDGVFRDNKEVGMFVAKKSPSRRNRGR